MRSLEIKMEGEMSGVVRDIFRRIKINTEFSGEGQKSICLTSTTQNEGKSTVALGLAQAFAEDLGKNILLVDADIRKSVQDQRMGYNKHIEGLTEYITEKIEITDAIYKTNMEGLYITPSGRLTENATQLFKRDRFKDYMNQVKDAFDMVIIDTPPLGYVVDAAVVASLADASIMVVGANMISRKEVKKNIEELKKVNDNFLGVILNKAKEGKDVYEKGHYAYYRGGE